jgi:epoxide hydrolase-like predicted phosphatase
VTNDNPIKAIIWDFGGVLMRTDDLGPRDKLAESLGLTRSEINYHIFLSPHGLKTQLGEIHPDQLWAIFQEEMKLTDEAMPDVIKAFWAGDRLDTDLVELIRSLKGKYRIALLSNAWSDLRHHMVSTWKIADAFDPMIISAEIGMAKPDESIFQYTVNKLDINPNEGVFIDDFGKNIEAAAAIGLHVIHFKDRDQAWAELTALLSDQ